MNGLRKCILVAGSVETDPTDGPVGSLIVVPAVGESGFHTSPQLSCEVDTDCVVYLHGDMTFLQITQCSMKDPIFLKVRMVVQTKVALCRACTAPTLFSL